MNPDLRAEATLAGAEAATPAWPRHPAARCIR